MFSQWRNKTEQGRRHPTPRLQTQTESNRVLHQGGTPNIKRGPKRSLRHWCYAIGI